MSETIHGTVERVYFASPTFSAGVIDAGSDVKVKFSGKFHVAEGEPITVVGDWQKHPKYGYQFAATGLSYDLPETQEGLQRYLAKSKAFRGIGEATAAKLVEYAGTGERLDHLIRNSTHVVLPLRRPKAKKQAEAQAMYVASDLSHWITNEPHIWADKVTIHGKEFTRMTPASLAWFRQQVAKAEDACAVGKLPLDAFGHIVDAFCPVYAFAVRVGMKPDLRANGGPASGDHASVTSTSTRNA